MQHRATSSTPHGSSHALRFVRALALAPALAGCPPEREAPPPVLIDEGSSGGVVTQGTLVQSNTVDTVVVQRTQSDPEQRVEMRTVVVGQPAVCVVGQVAIREPGQRCACVETGAGPQWQCAAAVDRCALGAMQVQPERRCMCVQTEHGNDWRCALMRMDYGAHPVGPLPPPELSV